MRKRRQILRPANWPDWFKPTGYPHFDQPVRDPEQIRHLVESPEQVAKHAFLPFIHFEKRAKKFKREKGQFVDKLRPISYASHVDSQIFRHYAQVLLSKYEEILKSGDFGEAVLAYRELETRKCNIDFAGDAFNWIRQNAPCVCLAFDLKDFFESLDHGLLKMRWMQVLGNGSLPLDHYKLFKAVTCYSFVSREKLLARLGISKRKFREWRGSLCPPHQFRTKVRADGDVESLVTLHPRGKGIPQGSPISALLSNIYMIPVDQYMASITKRLGAFYCRYSDDILIACNAQDRVELENSLRDAIRNLKLELHDGHGKFEVVTFSKDSGGKVQCDKPLQYLGFSFDGRDARIRYQTIARHRRKMREAVRRAVFLAIKDDGTVGEIKKKEIYRRYSHLGLGSNNFIRGYARSAQTKLKSNAIHNQIKDDWPELQEMIRKEKEALARRQKLPKGIVN